MCSLTRPHQHSLVHHSVHETSGKSPREESAKSIVVTAQHNGTARPNLSCFHCQTFCGRVSERYMQSHRRSAYRDRCAANHEGLESVRPLLSCVSTTALIPLLASHARIIPTTSHFVSLSESFIHSYTRMTNHSDGLSARARLVRRVHGVNIMGLTAR